MMMIPVRKLLLATAAGAVALGGLSVAQANDYTFKRSPVQEVVQTLDVNERAPDGSTPLMWAVYEGEVERVAQLLDAGADANAVNHYGANPMQLAAETANIEILELLLEAGADADSANPEGQTALMLVARTGNVDAAKLLVKHGATIDAREGWGGQSALMWASARRHPAMMDYLIRQGAEIDANSTPRDYKRHVTAEGRAKNLDFGGLTPLLYSIRENCLSCVDLLIEHGADLDKPDPEGVSPLVLSIMNSRWDIAKRLIDAGADVNQWDRYGRAPLLTAVAGHDNTGVQPNAPLNQSDGMSVLRLLLDKGANPNHELYLRPSKQRGGPLTRGTTPLIVAASGADIEVMKLLLEYGAKADHLQADRQSAVSAIAGSRGEGAAEGLRLLAEAGADDILSVMAVPHHLQRTRGGTPLHYAVRANNVEAVRTLVELGADINATDIDGLTPLDHAMSRNQVPFLQMRQPPNQRVAGLLRELGATQELDVTPFWPNVGPPFYYPWSIFPLDPVAEANELVPGSIDHQ